MFKSSFSVISVFIIILLIWIQIHNAYENERKIELCTRYGGSPIHYQRHYGMCANLPRNLLDKLGLE